MQPESPAPEGKMHWGELGSPKDHVCTPLTHTAQSPPEGGEGTWERLKKLLKYEILGCIVSILCQQRPIV